MDTESLVQMYRIAKMYYYDNCSQQEISQRENISRPQISRILKRAREVGMVQIEVTIPNTHQRQYLSSQIAQELELQQVIIVDNCNDSEAEDIAFAAKAAPHVQELIRNSYRIGIGWGNTMWRISQQLQGCRDEKKRVFVALIGMAASDIPCLQTNNIVERFAERYHGTTQFNNFKNCLFLEKMTGTDRQRWEGLQLAWNTMDTALIGIGDSRQTSKQYSIEFEDQLQVACEIESMTGDILGNFFNENGDIYAYPGGAHASSPKLHTLRRVKQVICAAYGISKVKSIIAAARLGFFKTLITNEETAQALWNRLEAPASPLPNDADAIGISVPD